MCDCVGNTVTVLVSKRHYRAGATVFFERVPAEQCSLCGKLYFSAQTLRRLDRAVDAQQETIAPVRPTVRP